MKLPSHKSCIEDAVGATVSVKVPKLTGTHLIPAAVLGEANQSLYWFGTRHGILMLGLSLECKKRNWLLLTKLLRLNYPAAPWSLLRLQGLFSGLRKCSHNGNFISKTVCV
jgi:hypothetical protein